jgi:hypothetical protein
VWVVVWCLEQEDDIWLVDLGGCHGGLLFQAVYAPLHNYHI